MRRDCPACWVGAERVRDLGRRSDAARPAPALGVNEPLELAQVEEEAATILALLDHEPAALE